MNLNFIHRFRWLTTFILLAAMSTLISLAIFASSQQVYRQDANDPQVEASEAIADAISQGAPAEAIIGQGSDVDMAKSLSIFIMIFDKDGKLVAGSGKLDGNDPNPPSGVFDYAKKHNDDRFTWQPKKGVRVAAVLKNIGNDKGFVLVGRNLREVEKREQALLYMIGVAWIGLLAISALLAFVLSRRFVDIAIVEENIVVETPQASEEISS